MENTRAGLRTGVLAAMLVWQGAAQAAIDATGAWFVEVALSGTPVFRCHIDVTPAGPGTLTISTADCLIFSSGTLQYDDATGDFTGSVAGAFPVCPNGTLSGTVAPDARTFEATAVCPDFFGVTLSGSRCGNFVVDEGEGCDDGDRDDFVDCCDSACSPRPAGSSCGFGTACVAYVCGESGTCESQYSDAPCDDYSDCTTGDRCTQGFCVGAPSPQGSACDDGMPCTTNDVCDGGGGCTGDIAPVDTPCDDGDQCTVDDHCTGYDAYECVGGAPRECGTCQWCDYYAGCVDGPRPWCAEPVGPNGRIRVRESADDHADALQWTWGQGSWTSLHDFGNPRTDTSFDVCVYQYGYDGLRLLASDDIPAGGQCSGRPCWSPRRRGYRYDDSRASGVQSLELWAGDDGQARIAVKGRGPGLGIGTLPVTGPVIAQVQASNGACWESAYYNDFDRNTPLLFEARRQYVYDDDGGE